MIPGCRREARLEEAPRYKKQPLVSPLLAFNGRVGQLSVRVGQMAFQLEKNSEDNWVSLCPHDHENPSGGIRCWPTYIFLLSAAAAALTPLNLLPTCRGSAQPQTIIAHMVPWDRQGVHKYIYIYIHFLACWNEGKCSQMYGCLTLIATQSVVHQ